MILFVYGSLKRGFSNHRLLAGKQFLGAARTAPEFRVYDYGGYPAAIRVGQCGYGIEGELWLADSRCLARIDQLECLDAGLYIRDLTPLEAPHSDLTAIIYQYNREVAGLPEIGSCWSREMDSVQ